MESDDESRSGKGDPDPLLSLAAAQKAELVRERNRRRGIKAWLTQDRNKLNDLLSASFVNRPALTSAYERFSTRLSNLMSVQSTIESLLPECEIDAEVLSQVDFIEDLYALKVTVEAKMVSTPVVPAGSSAGVSTSTSSASNNRQIRLPKYDLPVFKGAHEDWLSWKESFECAMGIGQSDEIDDRHKLNYLLNNALSGEAKETLGGIALDGANFRTAMELLESVYGRPSKLRRIHIRSLLHLRPPASSSSVELRKFYNDIYKHIRALEKLDIKGEKYGEILSEIVLDALPRSVVQEWSRHIGDKDDEEGNLDALMSFLKKELLIRERCSEESSSSAHVPTSSKHVGVGNKLRGHSSLVSQGQESLQSIRNSLPLSNRTLQQSSVRSPCPFDKANHHPGYCKAAESFSHSEIRELITKAKRCFICFGLHLAKACPNPGRFKCRMCQRHHHQLLKCDAMQNNSSSTMSTGNLSSSASNSNSAQGSPGVASQRISIQGSKVTQSQVAVPAESSSSSSVVQKMVSGSSLTSSTTSSVLFQTAAARAIGCNGKSQLVRILLDSASDRSYVTSSLAKALNCRSERNECLTVHGFGGHAVKSSSNVPRVKMILCAPSSNASLQLSASVIEQICLPPPYPPVSIQSYPHLRHLPLADERYFDEEQPISVLVGADFLGDVITGEVIKGPAGSPIAMGSIFNYILSGPVPEDSNVSHVKSLSCLLLRADSLESQLRVFWDIDSLGVVDSTENSEMDFALQHFQKHVRFVDGRYEVALPWKPSHPPLLCNKLQALMRYSRLEQKLQNEAVLQVAYREALKEFKEESFIEECNVESGPLEFYLPHRPVVRETSNTYKVRPVFDASARGPNGVSLNHCLMVGPSMVPLLVEILLRFRMCSVAFSADIRRAFLQVSIRPEDRDVLRFFWSTADDNPQVFRFQRVPFGASCSPFLLQATIQHHLSQRREEVAESMRNSFYVDNLFLGYHTPEEAFEKSLQATKIMLEAGMELREWTSNSSAVRKLWASNSSIFQRVPDGDDTISSKVLGLRWNVFQDTLSLPAAYVHHPSRTKREFLSNLSKVFDPLGWLGGFTLRGKLLMQKMWTSSISWDDPLPDELLSDVETFEADLQLLPQLSLPRWYFMDLHVQPSHVTLHLFCDASQKGYGCCLFALGSNGQRASSSLVISKCRVAPAKTITLPRLELLACLIGARLLSHVLKVFPCAEFYCWTDSTIALFQIKGDPSRWKTFVSNRVGEIQKLTPLDRWFHVPGDFNPADLASRPESLSTMLSSSLWWHGPEWLLDSSQWPEELVSQVITSDELRTPSSQTLLVMEAQDPFGLQDVNELDGALRRLCWWKRFIDFKCRHLPVVKGPLSHRELLDAELHFIRASQRSYFPVEWKCLSNGLPLSSRSDLLQLGLRWSEEFQVIVSVGRESDSQLILLPSNAKITQLISSKAHQRLLHAGIEATLAKLRSRYWIIHGRRSVKKAINLCIACRRYLAKPYLQREAALPADRVTAASPFAVSGVDFAGPFLIKEGKVHICVFTCAVTRAVHLELVEQLKADTFLLAFRRFLGRRGNCRIMYSDNALTFVKARQRFPEVSWKFIISRAPWWGGFYERLVSLIKSSLRRTFSGAKLSFREMETLLIEVEGALNRRPLTIVSDRVDDPAPLTPFHFMGGPPPEGIDEVLPDFSEEPFLLPRWRKGRTLLQQWWKRWKSTYLLRLHEWRVKHPQGKFFPSPGDLVIVEEDGVSRFKWPLARVQEVIFGGDGFPRAAVIKRGKYLLRRATRRLYPLECSTFNKDETLKQNRAP